MHKLIIRGRTCEEVEVTLTCTQAITVVRSFSQDCARVKRAHLAFEATGTACCDIPHRHCKVRNAVRKGSAHNLKKCDNIVKSAGLQHLSSLHHKAAGHAWLQSLHLAAAWLVDDADNTQAPRQQQVSLTAQMELRDESACLLPAATWSDNEAWLLAQVMVRGTVGIMPGMLSPASPMYPCEHFHKG